MFGLDGGRLNCAIRETLIDEPLNVRCSKRTGIGCFPSWGVYVRFLEGREVLTLSNVDFRTSENLGKSELLKTRKNRLKLDSKRGTFQKSDTRCDIDIMEGSQERGVAVVSGRPEDNMLTVNIVNIKV